MLKLDQATQQNAALVEESSAAAESLSSQSKALISAIEMFKTSKNVEIKKVEPVKVAATKVVAKPFVSASKSSYIVNKDSSTSKTEALIKPQPIKASSAPAAGDLDEWQNF